MNLQPGFILPGTSGFNYFDSFFKHTRQNSVLVMDDSGTILDVNTAFTNSFGFTREDIVGRNSMMLFTEEDQAKQLPLKELQQVLSHGQAFDNNFLVGKDKVLIWVSGESILVIDAEGNKRIVKIIQNINSQKISENAIIRLDSFNESILRSIEDVVIVINDQLDILKVNQAFSKVFGRSMEKNQGTLNFSDVVGCYDTGADFLQHLKEFITGKNQWCNHALEIQTVDSDKRIYEFFFSTVEHSGIENNTLLVAHDITEQKQAEIEREDIIGFVAHELRNPLANIVLCNEMMSQLIADKNIKDLPEYLQRSKNNVMRLNKMISELYDVTKLNSGNFTLEKTMFDFEEMIEEALDTLEVLHPDYSIIVEGECTEPVFGDRYRLIQVVTNFLSNGIKYSNNQTKVVIHLAQENGVVTVYVRDEGLGISNKHLPHIFGRFFRAEKTKNLEGIGLGLYLCRRIIEAHGGKIWAESEEGKGSSFYFSIPLNN